MADWFLVELYIEGNQKDVEEFLEEELDGLEIKEEDVRFQIDDIDPQPYGTMLVGHQAHDEGEMWVGRMRDKYPNLTFNGLVQNWESF